MCAGSTKYIGVPCLREWLESKKQFKEGPLVNSYIWKGLECEICKSPFNASIKDAAGNEISLLSYKMHENSENYLILESISTSLNKTIHVFNFD